MVSGYGKGTYTKSVGTEPLLVPRYEALAFAHHNQTSNVQSPRMYVDKSITSGHLTVVRLLNIYISMSIYHCISLDYDFETARFHTVKNRSADKRFYQKKSARLAASPSPKPTTGSASVDAANVIYFYQNAIIIKKERI
jgi:hypothetical protein